MIKNLENNIFLQTDVILLNEYFFMIMETSYSYSFAKL